MIIVLNCGHRDRNCGHINCTCLWIESSKIDEASILLGVTSLLTRVAILISMKFFGSSHGFLLKNNHPWFALLRCTRHSRLAQQDLVGIQPFCVSLLIPMPILPSLTYKSFKFWSHACLCFVLGMAHSASYFSYFLFSLP